MDLQLPGNVRTGRLAAALAAALLAISVLPVFVMLPLTMVPVVGRTWIPENVMTQALVDGSVTWTLIVEVDRTGAPRVIPAQPAPPLPAVPAAGLNAKPAGAVSQISPLLSSSPAAPSVITGPASVV